MFFPLAPARTIPFFLIAILLSVTSCKEGDEDVIVHVHNATLKVNVYTELFNGSGDPVEVSIPSAVIELYEEEIDRDLQQHMVISQQTDSSGWTYFYNLKKDYYYLRCTHANFGEQVDEVSTPDGTVSFVDIIY